jgi:hypothetical protein
MKLREKISWLMGTSQRQLFSRLEECWERPFTDKEQQLASILELVHIEQFVVPSSPQRFGRKKHDPRALARPFVAKAVYNHPFTRSTRETLRTSRWLRRLCGYARQCHIPSESVFSRAFAEFAERSSEYPSNTLEDVHAAIRGGRSGQGSLPCSTPRQSRAGTSPGSPHIRRLPPRPGVGSSNRR